jgi:hypothetical protein
MTADNTLLDLDKLRSQVLRNCEISDSHHAGLYSICGLALRLRDLYKWENNLNPWIEKDSSEILEWIGNKEQRWEEINSHDYAKISIFERHYDSFDIDGINKALKPHGLFYGAGYAQRLKPSFFLAQIESISTIGDRQVVSLGHELARDLLTIPALSQDGDIILRKASARLYLWDQLIYINKSARPALNFALKECGLKDNTPETLRRGLDKLLEVQQETYIYHELGEISDDVFERDTWAKFIATHPHTPIELITRAIKDLLADTNQHGTLQHMIKKRNAAALGFYVAFFNGLVKELFPELEISFRQFIDSGDWQVIEKARAAGNKRARHYAAEMIDIHETGQQNNDPDWIKNQVEKRIIKKILPLAK